MKDTYERAIDEGTEFAHDRPNFCAVLAPEILPILMLFALEVMDSSSSLSVHGEADRVKLTVGPVKIRRVCVEQVLVLILSSTIYSLVG
jgi:hypothetical protein